MKKILILSNNALSLHENNGKTLASLFSGVNSEALAQLYFNGDKPESEKFTKFYRITDLDIVKRIISFGASEGGSKILPSAIDFKSGNENNRLKKIIIKNENLKIIARNFLFGSGLWRSKKLINWIDEFRPDSIFFVAGNYVFPFYIASFISKKYNIPLDIYITDDYILSCKYSAGIKKIIHDSLIGAYKKFLPQARNVFAIGEDMASEFGQEFNRKFIPIMNSVDVPDFYENKIRNHGDKYEFIYTGGLHLGRDKSLIDFGRILKTIRDEEGKNIYLIIYSLQRPAPDILKSFNDLGILYGGALSQSDVKNKLSQANFVLHVESPDEEYINKTRLSISTKIPEYLISGACLIAYGPPSLSSIKIVRDNNLGLCVSSSDNFDVICRRVSNLVNDEMACRDFSYRGYLYAKMKFDVRSVNKLIDKFLNE